MVKVKKFQPLDSNFEKIYMEIADVLRSWATPQKYHLDILPIEKSRQSLSPVAFGGNFFADQDSSKIEWPLLCCLEVNFMYWPQTAIISHHILQWLRKRLLVSYSLNPVDVQGVLQVDFTVRREEGAEDAVQFAHILEEHLREWLPKKMILLDEIEVKMEY